MEGLSMLRKAKMGEGVDRQLQNLSWDADIVLLTRKSQRLAWRMFAGAVVVIFLLCVAIILMMPLKSTVPYVFTVDKLTGEVAVAATAKDFVKSTELNDKYWVKQFLLSHERYNYRLLQADYDTVRLLSGDNVYSLYAARFEGNDSMDKRFADNVQIIPQILSISITGGNLATVRFERRQQEMRAGGEAKTTRWVALVRYEYKPQLGRKEPELIQNPLGFTVVGYQVDPELTSDVPGALK
jgi:type IV secretion system protein VirB8